MDLNKHIPEKMHEWIISTGKGVQHQQPSIKCKSNP